MGQKVHPKIFRIGITSTWNSKWISSKKNYKSRLKEDILIRSFLKERLKEAGIARIEIERAPNAITVTIYAAKPGLIIGRGGEGAEKIKKEIQTKFFVRPDKKTTLNLNIQEVERSGLSAEVVLQNIIADIEKRIPYRRTMKQTISRVERAGAKGVKVRIAGRLDGAEIARDETLAVGKIPLHTLRADIDYAQGFARTIYGAIGVKVWIYKGEVFKK